ncbi:hypothetical protein N431DRAFT_523905 [Stipitochalara longipes BDJ]|nr:hypothetical protein N431DRAFT_523905 [Stipitochalara longipes BDJ]
MPSETFNRAMRYLRLVREKLELPEVEDTNAPSELHQQENFDDDHGSDGASSRCSTSSKPRSRSSSISAWTTASEIAFGILMEAEQADDTNTIQDFKATMNFIARRVTYQKFKEMMGIAFKGARHPGEQFAHAFTQIYSNINLGRCDVLGTLHMLEEGRRCHRCDAQLCKDCENCILKRCTLATNKPEFSSKPIVTSQTNLELLAAEYGLKPTLSSRLLPIIENPDWQSRDSLAAKRIAANCHRYRCLLHTETPEHCQNDKNMCFIHPRHLSVCICTEFLMKPEHDCESGEFHFCKTCFESAVQDMGHSNTKTIWFKTKNGGEEGLSQYTCGAGFASRSYLTTT